MASIAHSIFLIFFTIFWLNQETTYGDEVALIKWTSAIKRLLLDRDEKPDRKDLFFINVSWDKQIVKKLDEDGLFPIGNQAITDRIKLAKLFQILNKKPDNHKFVLCDIFFKDSSPSDSLLKAQIEQVNNLIIPYHRDPDGVPDFPIFSCQLGLADYTTIQGSFLKFSLIHSDTLKTIPIMMYERIHNAIFSKQTPFYYMNDKLSLNSIILDFKIRNHHLKGDNAFYYWNLGDLIKLAEVSGDSTILDLVKDRVLVIGDFEDRDLHSTVLGKMAGPLIIINAYLALVNEENIISMTLLIILFSVYFVISWIAFSSLKLAEIAIIRKLYHTNIGKNLIEFISYLIFLGIISTLFYYAFNIHINILVIAVYMKSLETVIRLLQNKRGKTALEFWKSLMRFLNLFRRKVFSYIK